MHVHIDFAMRGFWWSYRFVCPKCQHVAVAKVFGYAEGAGPSRRWANAEAERMAEEDARKVLETAACPRCQHRDQAKLRRYDDWETRLLLQLGLGGVAAWALMVAVIVLASSVQAPLMAALVVAAVVVPAFSLAGFTTAARRRKIPSAAARVVFPANANVPAPPVISCYDALFLCAMCQEPAAKLTLREGRLEQRGFVEDVDDEIEDAAVDALTNKLGANDAKALFASDASLVPFYCSACETCYCAAHWTMSTVRATGARETAGLIEAVEGRCPAGHGQNLTP